MKRFLTLAAVLAASTCYGCVAHAQTPCPGGVCPAVQQATYATPVRQVIHGAAQVLTQATAPRCGERRQPVRDAIRKVFGGRCR